VEVSLYLVSGCDNFISSWCWTRAFNSCFLPKRLISTASWLVPSVKLLLSVPTRISNTPCLDMLLGNGEKWQGRECDTR
jgi:hypothetical protein